MKSLLTVLYQESFLDTNNLFVLSDGFLALISTLHDVYLTSMLRPGCLSQKGQWPVAKA